MHNRDSLSIFISTYCEPRSDWSIRLSWMLFDSDNSAVGQSWTYATLKLSCSNIIMFLHRNFAYGCYVDVIYIYENSAF